MMSSDEVREYKNLYQKFCRTCFDIACMIHDYVPDFPRFGDWKIGDEGKIYTCTENGSIWSFHYLLLELDKETIEKLLKDNPAQVYSFTRI